MRRQRFHVLVVDDEPMVGRLVTELLQRVGLETTTVETARQALDKLSRHEIDLVITDLQMADLSGLDLCRELHETYPDLPVIAMSGSGPVGHNLELKHAQNAGAVGVVSKPFRMDDFYREVAEALHRRGGVPDDFFVSARRADV